MIAVTRFANKRPSLYLVPVTVLTAAARLSSSCSLSAVMLPACCWACSQEEREGGWSGSSCGGVEGMGAGARDTGEHR